LLTFYGKLANNPELVPFYPRPLAKPRWEIFSFWNLQWYLKPKFDIQMMWWMKNQIKMLGCFLFS